MTTARVSILNKRSPIIWVLILSYFVFLTDISCSYASHIQEKNTQINNKKSELFSKSEIQKFINNFDIRANDFNNNKTYTIKSHTSKSPAWLKEKLKHNQNRGSSTYLKIDDAQQIIKETLMSSQDGILKWLNSNNNDRYLVLNSEHKKNPIGFGFIRGNDSLQYFNTAKIVLIRNNLRCHEKQKDCIPFIVITSYPTSSRE